MIWLCYSQVYGIFLDAKNEVSFKDIYDAGQLGKSGAFFAPMTGQGKRRSKTPTPVHGEWQFNKKEEKMSHPPRPAALSWGIPWVNMLSAWEDELRGDNCSCFSAKSLGKEWDEHWDRNDKNVRWSDMVMLRSTSPSRYFYSPTFLWSIQDKPIWVGGIFPWSTTWAGLCNCTGVPWITSIWL